MISVVIPLYNKAHTIVNTLSTVINQIYTDFEIVIVVARKFVRHFFR